MEPKVPFKWRGKHHSYFGISFIIFGLVFLWLDWYDPDRILWLWGSFIDVGIYKINDDWIEHNVTASTPLRILYMKLILPLLQQGLKR